MEALEHDRRAALPFGEHALDVRRAGEGGRAPGDVDRVVADAQLIARLDKTETRVAQVARADELLDLGLREQVVESTCLVPLDRERPALPVLLEELFGVDRVDAAPKSAGARRPCRRCRSRS